MNQETTTNGDCAFAESVVENQRQLASALKPHYDFIVCGAGSSGSVVAGQLAANPDVSVLLLEAGGSDDLETVMNPNQWPANLGSGLDWNFVAEPNPHLNGRAIPYSMGKVLGGGGSINVCTWSRGHKADWDYFAEAASDPGWNYKSVLDLYQRIENYGGSSGHNGSRSRMWVQPAQNPHPFYTAVLESMSAQGICRFDRLSGELWEAPHGCAYVDEIVHDGRRQSPFRSYVYPKMGQPNLTVLTNTVVTRILLEGQRATGIEFIRNGRVAHVHASLETILSLGAVHTPKILMQSGIGDEAKLKPFDIPIRKHLPGVGRHLHDHVSISCAWEASDVDMPTAPRGQAVCFWKTDPALELPNALAFAAPIIPVTGENSAKFHLPALGWSLVAGMATEGRGELFLTGRSPSDPVRIETNFMAERKDLQTALEVIAMCRHIGNGEALRPFVKREVLPGDLQTAEMEQFIRDGIVTFWHQSGGTRMGSDSMSVVDGQLRVRGIEGIRVADASIMPRVTVGNTMAPCVVIGERASNLLKAQHGV